jgi:hypothetical protein
LSQNSEGKSIAAKTGQMWSGGPAFVGEPQNQFLYEFILRRNTPNDHFILLEAKRDFINNRVNLKDPFQ